MIIFEVGGLSVIRKRTDRQIKVNPDRPCFKEIQSNVLTLKITCYEGLYQCKICILLSRFISIFI